MAELCAEWRPDVLLCGEVDFGAMIAAELLGLRHATVLSSASGSIVRLDLLREPLDAVRAEHGLPPDPEVRMPWRHLALSPFPPSLRDPALPRPACGFRAVEPAVPVPREPPLVLFTLGTVFNLECGDLFDRVVAGLRLLEVEALVTVGRELDPGELGPQPARIRVERYVPQAEVLPSCSAVVSHGGSGTLLGAVAHGLPSVLLPLGADQQPNAERAAELGIGRVLDVERVTPEEVADALADVLADPSYRRAAEALREEAAQLPPPEEALALVEALAVEASSGAGCSR